MGWGCSSLVKHSLSMLQGPSFNPQHHRKEERKKGRREARRNERKLRTVTAHREKRLGWRILFSNMYVTIEKINQQKYLSKRTQPDICEEKFE
jgi:hypothetical protein